MPSLRMSACLPVKRPYWHSPAGSGRTATAGRTARRTSGSRRRRRCRSPTRSATRALAATDSAKSATSTSISLMGRASRTRSGRPSACMRKTSACCGSISTPRCRRPRPAAAAGWSSRSSSRRATTSTPSTGTSTRTALVHRGQQSHHPAGRLAGHAGRAGRVHAQAGQVLQPESRARRGPRSLALLSRVRRRQPAGPRHANLACPHHAAGGQDPHHYRYTSELHVHNAVGGEYPDMH